MELHSQSMKIFLKESLNMMNLKMKTGTLYLNDPDNKIDKYMKIKICGYLRGRYTEVTHKNYIFLVSCYNVSSQNRSYC